MFFKLCTNERERKREKRNWKTRAPTSTIAHSCASNCWLPSQKSQLEFTFDIRIILLCFFLRFLRSILPIFFASRLCVCRHRLESCLQKSLCWKTTAWNISYLDIRIWFHGCLLKHFIWVWSGIARAFHKRDFKRRYSKWEWYHFNHLFEWKEEKCARFWCHDKTKSSSIKEFWLKKFRLSSGVLTPFLSCIMENRIKLILWWNFRCVSVWVHIWVNLYAIAVKWLYEVPIECIDEKKKKKKAMAKSDADSSRYCFRIKLMLWMEVGRTGRRL